MMKERLNYNDSNGGISQMFPFSHLELISLEQLAKILNIATTTAAINWCKINEISVFRRCNRNMVYQIEVDIAIDRLLVRTWIHKYPKDWEEKYKVVAKDERVCQLVIEEIKGSPMKSPSTIVKPISKSDTKLLNRLNS